MEEKIIVSLTSYGKRLNNLPVVLDTMYAQTLPPDLVVLNLAYEEILPKDVENYLRSHNVEINRVADTKVYKKIIPTLKKYPDDCIIGIDDDWLYPSQMIEDFINIHKKYPNNPISGNRVIINGIQCHCGCASLIKKEYFGEYLDLFDNDIYVNCKSDDVFYTYCATKAGHPYVRTDGIYTNNMVPYNPVTSYSEEYSRGIGETWKYLNCRFGYVEPVLKKYFQMSGTEHLVDDIESSLREQVSYNFILNQKYESVLNSHAFRMGNFLLKPFQFIKKLLNKDK